MKNKKLFLLGLGVLLTLGACNKNVENSSNTSSSSQIEIITGIEIVGPTSVLVGKTIRLTSDVLGSTNDDVSWSSSDQSIATINNEGVVTGISEGSVDIIATSKNDSSKSASYTINVTLPKATELTLFIDENENISYDNKKDIYTVLLGQTFYVDVSYLPLDSKQPDISYTVSFKDGSTDTSFVSLEIVPDTTKAKIICYKEINGLIITADGKYNDLTAQDLKSSIEVNVIDKNLEKYIELNELINSFEEKEINELVSSEITRNKTIKSNNNTYKTLENITHKSYLNSSYVNKDIKVYDNNELTLDKTFNYYQGLNIVDAKEYFYTFEYDDNQNILNFFNTINDTKRAGLIVDINVPLDEEVDNSTSTITYGYTNLLTNLISSDTNIYDGSIVTFGNQYAYAYSEIEINNDNFIITSTCYDEDYDINYTLFLEVTYNNQTLTGYIFNEEIVNGDTTITYNEEAKNLVYNTKVTDSVANNGNYLDLNQYYVDDFEIVKFNEKDPNGKYDYSDTSKYGISAETTENGLVKYITSYDKTIVLKANALSPDTANINFDNIKATSSDTNQIPSVTSITDGIFTINAKKDDFGNSLPGEAIFSFTSSKGITKQIIIEFTQTILESVNVTFGQEKPTFNTESNTYIFNPIFKGNNSDYFFINTKPDEDIYSFVLIVIEGEKDGIELFQYSSDNIYGYPGFSFAIKGNKTGTYKFQIAIKNNEHIKDSKIFELTVNETYSIDYISNKIIGESYCFNGSTASYTFTFEDSTTLKYVEEYSYGGSRSTSFKYHIEEGAIIIDETQNFLNDMYFSRISEGKVLFNNDFTILNFYIEIYYSSNYVDGKIVQDYFTYNIDFKKVNKPIDVKDIADYINGKTFKNNTGEIIVSFNDGKGELIYYATNGTLLAKITFDYAYSSSLKNLKISNSNSSNPIYILEDSYCEFDSYNQNLVFRITEVKNESYVNYKISIFQ